MLDFVKALPGPSYKYHIGMLFKVAGKNLDSSNILCISFGYINLCMEIFKDNLILGILRELLFPRCHF